MSKIKEIIAREINDSIGRPTVEVELEASNGSFIASCPSGESTGKNEAVALPAKKAVENVNNIIAPKLKGKDLDSQKELDELMNRLDGTQNKSNLGANAILPISIAICKTGAALQKLSLYDYISKISGNNNKIPLGSFNFIEGGAHAVNKNTLDLQEFMVVPQKIGRAHV